MSPYPILYLDTITTRDSPVSLENWCPVTPLEVPVKTQRGSSRVGGLQKKERKSL